VTAARTVTLLGSTGSIGTQAIDVVRHAPDRFRVVALAAGGDNVGLLAKQALELEVEAVAVARASAAQDLQLAFYAHAQQRGYAAGSYRVPKIIAGPDAATELAEVTVQQALAHPTWAMGRVVTVNSATLMNKGLELIEAHLLFGTPYERIEVVVHPQSVVHSMVEFADGSTLCQASPPDMRLPIALALGWPDRVPDAAAGIDWTASHDWRFEPLDRQAFPAVRLAREAGGAGGVVPAILNAANEEAVADFLAGRLPFLGIVDTVAQVVAEAPRDSDPSSVDEVVAAEEWARARARELISDDTVASGRRQGSGS
jgi:1-deoxy-D-xylulose 5-phosphate reductoisomerase